MRIPTEEALLLEKSQYFYVFGQKNPQQGEATPIRILDMKGFIKVQRGNGMAIKTTAGDYLTAVKKLWDDMAVYQTELIARPDYYLCMGARVMDYTAADFDQLELLMDIEVGSLEPETEIIVVAANIKQS